MDNEELELKKQAAIEAALNNNWPDAINLNQEILHVQPKDSETLNRLGRAFMENGMIGKAKTTYRTVLEVDPYNTIAAKNIEKLSTLSKQDLEKMSKDNQVVISADLFLEEPGRTKVIDLVDLPMGKILATLHTGDPVNLEVHSSDVTVTQGNRRLGKLPAELTPKFAQALKAGSKFSAIVKAVAFKKSKNGSTMSIFVRETFHSPKIESGPFFQSNNNNHGNSFVREETLGLMDRRDEIVVENDEETTENSDHLNGHLTDDEEHLATHHEVVEDEENFPLT